MSFIDVGQGGAILVQSGGKNYLSTPESREGPSVADFLRSRGVEVLDDIVDSNPDAAHIRGLLDGLDAYEVQTVYLSGDPKGTSTFNTFMRGVRDEGSWVKEVRAGYQTDWVAGGWIHESRSPQPLELAFQRRIGDKTATAELVRA